MRTDDPAHIQGALGLIEDAMAEMNNAWAEASGLCADFELWRRMEYLRIKEEIKDKSGWVKGTTETEKKDDIEAALYLRYPDEFEAHRNNLRQKAMGDALFKGLDARRSIGQTLLKPHLRDDPKFGQEAWGQHGTPEPNP